MPQARERFASESVAAADDLLDGGWEKSAPLRALTPTRVQLRNKNPRRLRGIRRHAAPALGRGLGDTLKGYQARRRGAAGLRGGWPLARCRLLIVSGDEDEPCLDASLMLKRRCPRPAWRSSADRHGATSRTGGVQPLVRALLPPGRSRGSTGCVIRWRRRAVIAVLAVQDDRSARVEALGVATRLGRASDRSAQLDRPAPDRLAAPEAPPRPNSLRRGESPPSTRTAAGGGPATADHHAADRRTAGAAHLLHRVADPRTSPAARASRRETR